ncbi:hypothetical protein VitviT2T_030067 [Vitis vinifera]|uniref:Uncharacterized protein n=1 Tax=Vitis vinifera TaxID=29760 RepID=A0ABY9E2J2_VITVI|nr:hypothetical protein VitviT2T_030067 [Vitis vinifera]
MERASKAPPAAKRLLHTPSLSASLKCSQASAMLGLGSLLSIYLWLNLIVSFKGMHDGPACDVNFHDDDDDVRNASLVMWWISGVSVTRVALICD